MPKYVKGRDGKFKGSTAGAAKPPTSSPLAGPVVTSGGNGDVADAGDAANVRVSRREMLTDFGGGRSPEHAALVEALEDEVGVEGDGDYRIVADGRVAFGRGDVEVLARKGGFVVRGVEEVRPASYWEAAQTRWQTLRTCADAHDAVVYGFDAWCDGW